MNLAVKVLGLALLATLPFSGVSDYHLHLFIQIFIWALIYTGWSLMGRFGLVSLGHGGFLGINVTWEKLKIIMLSAGITSFGGILYGQYQMYLNPTTLSGISVSLQIVFAVVAGGMFVQFGPTVGAVFTLMLAEILRVLIGNQYPGSDTTLYGLLLILFIIFMPKGILGALQAKFGPNNDRVPRSPGSDTAPRDSQST